MEVYGNYRIIYNGDKRYATCLLEKIDGGFWNTVGSGSYDWCFRTMSEYGRAHALRAMGF